MSTISDEVCGLTESHLCCWKENLLVHSQLVGPLSALSDGAKSQGIELAVASGFRSFERQLAIWNGKARGERPVLDDQGVPLDISQLSEVERLFAILRWSALPGASRHHWGTDIDVWDKAAVAADYRLELVTDEYTTNGPFSRLNHWLSSPEVDSLGFVRPYAVDRGGIAPEPWHLSYLPLSRHYQNKMSPELLIKTISSADVALKEVILSHMDDIFERFISLKVAA